MKEERVPVPRSLEEVDNGRILGFGADLSEDHPVSFLLASQWN